MGAKGGEGSTPAVGVDEVTEPSSESPPRLAATTNW